MSEIFIARQPIFTRDMHVHAYELLFRQSGGSNQANVLDGDSATSQVVLNAFINIGMTNIVGSSPAFINLTRTFLTNPDLILTPPEQIVMEVLEDIEPEPEVLKTLASFKQRGHKIALDDFVYDDKYIPMIQLADYIKVDVMSMDQQQITDSYQTLKPFGVKMLAEKVETQEEFDFLKSLGFDYFQGYFFSKPDIVAGRSITPNQLNLLDLIARIHNPDIEVDDLSQIISHDVSLSHKVLKFINSPMSGIRSVVDSIQHAVVLIGLKTIKNWATLLALANGTNKPTELSITALTRARCCQLLAQSAGIKRTDSYFTVGLFSMLDAMMDMPMDEILNDLPLADEIEAALLNHEGDMGSVLKCTLSMERNDFSLTGYKDLDLTDLSDVYLQSIRWADQLSQQL